MTKFTFATSKEGFDNHIDKSVRGYSQLWGDILNLSKYFVEDYTQVVDMGCSSGKLLKGMIEQNGKNIPHAQYTGIEIEEDFFGDYPHDEEKFHQLNYFRGDVRELCAGSVAMVFEKIGGEVIYFGKPYPEVYNQSIDNVKKRILSIGDNLNTDIKGANILNYHSLLISNGVHREEINDKGVVEVLKQYEAIVNYIQSDLKW